MIKSLEVGKEESFGGRSSRRRKVVGEELVRRARSPITTESPRQAGPQARVSGKDSVPPAKRRWVPPSTLRHQDALTPESRNDLVFRKVRGILNKLTPEKFKKLSDDLLRFELHSEVILKGVILLIFEKALDEPKYSSMYAQLCKRLCQEAPNFEPPDQLSTFQSLLLKTCKVEFCNRSIVLDQHRHRQNAGATDAIGAADNNHRYHQQENVLDDVNTPAHPPSQGEDEVEHRQLAKRKILGNIRFICELGKLDILSENILHLCIQELLVRRGYDRAEDLECLCQIMRTCGRILDNDKGKYLMNQYFWRIRKHLENYDLQPRIRFMLKDIIDLRQDNWVPRKATVVEGPMPIHQIRPVEDDRPAYRNRGGGGGGGGGGANNRDGGGGGERGDRGGGGMPHDRDSDRPSNELFRHPMKTRSGIDDLMIGINLNAQPNLISSVSPYGGGGGGHNGYGGRDGGQRDGNFRGHNNQRSGGYNNFTQRGPYKQNNSNLQYNNQSNKEVAPRFKKSLMIPREELGEVELRPNSMLFNKAIVKTNNMMNRTMEPQFIQTTTNLNTPSMPATIKPPATPLHKEPLPIKQPADKPKQSKKDKGPSKEEVIKKFMSLLDEYYKGEIDLKQAINSYKEQKVLDKHVKDLVLSGLSLALEKSDVEQEKLIRLLSNLKEENALNGNSVQDSFKSLCHVLENKNDLEKATHAASVLLGTAISEHLISLADVSSLTDNGAHYPLFLLVLQFLHKKCGRSELSTMFNKSKINLLTQLQENDRTKERLSEILDERDLTFLYPLLQIQAELSKQLAADPNPQVFYKWIRENLDSSNFTDPGFINALVTVLLKYITQEAASGTSDEKAVAEKEKSMLERYQPILHSFLREKSPLQVVTVYSLQVHFYTLGFPRGHLLRWFMAMYDLEIIDEEAFLNWKEDLSDAYPGKGNALFQVNQWLTWLQEAESEEEEGDD